MGQQGISCHNYRAEQEKDYVHIEEWRNQSLQGGKYPYVYVDGIYLRRNWGGEYENVAILMAIAVNEDGYREVLGVAEGFKEDKFSWVNFFQWLCGQGLNFIPKVKLVSKMLKAIHAQESKKASREKAKAVVEDLRTMKLKEARQEGGGQRGRNIKLL